ncbi:MAG: NAD-dependent epimerase/dehydratase family protein [Saprospiraceae bacterium]|nr:NAD-dependent epimerase/dehydratase family protein [Saprospiraceae bacterium]
MSQLKILVIGACGQIGTVLTQALYKRYGTNAVVASDIRTPTTPFDCIFESLNILDKFRLNQLIKNHQINCIYHLAAILSAKGEANPIATWEFNMSSLFNVLEAARKHQISKVFFPSSIAVFGEGIDKQFTAQNAPLYPTTVYGMSKAAGENWSQYYFQRYGLDIRSVRYPGIIGYQSLPGGGTTDYAVDIFHKAIANETFTCFLLENTTLPMMYMDDAIAATIQIMEAPQEQIAIRTSYNIAGMSFSPKEIAVAIQKHFPTFKVVYQPDFRQNIADSWPQVIDDAAAKKDWGWQASYQLTNMVEDMLFHLKK